MNRNILCLKHKLEQIKKRGEIRLPSNQFVNIGLYFENLLGIEKNSFPVADIDGIEIKVSRSNSNYRITLFNCTCDGPGFFELNRLVNSFGVRDAIYRETKILYIDLMCTNYSNWGKNLKMKLHIDYRCGKIYIIVAHSSGKIIEKRSYWDFETLYKLINQKLNCLCLCSYSITYRHCERFCKLDNYVFLEQLSFENFLKALECGDIHVGVKYGVYKNGNRKGMSYNHGTSFNIKKNALFNLFEHF